jgi:hypothetical protein
VLDPNQERDDRRLRERERERERELNLREIERGRVIVKGWAPYIVKWTAKIAPKQSYPMARTKI